RATTSSGVRSALATPRTPSVPKRSNRPLPLRVLRSLPGLLQAVLLALLLTGVAREKAGPLERGPQVAVELDEAAGDAEPQRTGLPGHAATVDRGIHVVDVCEGREPQRLGDDHPVRLGREVVLDHAAVDD